MNRSRVRAPGSIGNVGPGFDVLGLGVGGIGITVSIEPDSDGPRVDAILGRDSELLPKDNEKNASMLAALGVFRELGVAAEFRMTLENELPFSGGLGGSATAAVAGAGAALVACGRSLDPMTVLRFALAAEEELSGRHLDNVAASVLGGLTLTRDPDSIDVFRIPVAADWRLVLITPRARVVTKEARSILPQTWARSLWIRQMAQTAALVHAFGTGDADLLGRALKDGFAEPLRSGLIPRFYEMQSAAIDAGAAGCSISGSGPTVFAICVDDPAARAVASAMAEASGGDPALVHVGPIADRGVEAIS